MILRFETLTEQDADAAHVSVRSLVKTWGHDLSKLPPTKLDEVQSDDGKAIDPVALSALLVSIPSAALAVTDLADRIRKRRRAKELIDHARRLASQRVVIYLVEADNRIEITQLNADQILDHAASDKTGR